MPQRPNPGQLVAQRLPQRKAVAFHLGNAYRKLDVRGRRKLARGLAQP